MQKPDHAPELLPANFLSGEHSRNVDSALTLLERKMFQRKNEELTDSDFHNHVTFHPSYPHPGSLM